ncbi:hypothetical protein GCM10010365_16290 [Streptomyces poonensis]|uniref:Uncharacterized protein n=1 Tax=Streptomyces poonensis TaxID=68255 RepID=A0A918PD93_9ACTN|nr:hypothetical protein GCM10010365_16290 [Streptomyces poonensis]
MNSEVPMAKTATASRYSGRGIKELRGEEKHEKGRLVTAVSARRHTRPARPAAARGGTEGVRTQ